ncbi:endopeptidase La [Mycoplasmatota bacterium]|nr:endopeptidase La [Mycoplasmatota bacterium]
MQLNNKVIERAYPAMAIRGIVALPDNDIRLEVGREFSKKALLEAEKHDNHIVLLIQKSPLIENPKPEDLYDRAIIGKITMKIKLPNGNYKVKVNGIVRAKVNYFVSEEPYFSVFVESMPFIQTNVDEEIALIRMIVNEVVDNSEDIFMNGKNVVSAIQSGVTSEKLANIVAFNLKIHESEKVKYLVNPDVNERLQSALKDIEREKYLHSLENDINKQVRESIDENQKEYYLREKMKAIQNELGDKAKKETEIDQLKNKIIDKGMPSEIEEKALNELSRYETLPASSAESGVIRTYLDFLVDLPWTEATEDNDDIKNAEKVLDEGHYGLEKVKERILEYLAVKIATKKNPQTILCLVGPPGVGKTSLAHGIAEALNRKFVKVALGGVKDESEIRGHRRTYIGALPGRVLQSMKKAKVINPLFLIDEIDKMSSNFRGDPASAMLEVLDPEQNKFFSDHYLEEEYDLSNVLFIATANYLENIPAPLRDRMEIVQLSSYTEDEKLEIAKNHLIKRQMSAHGLTKNEFKVSDAAIMEIIQKYTREAGVRQLDRLIGSLSRKAIKKILEKEIKQANITKTNLVDYLGKSLFSHNRTEKKDQIGVVTGLAYTQFGGDTLPVEVTYFEGNGKLVLTGKLGDVMKESAQAALSFVKSNSSKYNINPKLFKENDIHIHVPEGAVPKDGPSAGITITTAIVSALTNRKVDRLTGMTGEITLRGRVLPIGGLKEKSIAAHRSGLKQIIIPKDNEKDIDDIPKSIRESLEIKSVDDINDVIKIALR